MTRESGRESRDVEADESHDGRRHQNIIDAGARGSAATRLTGAGGRERKHGDQTSSAANEKEMRSRLEIARCSYAGNRLLNACMNSDNDVSVAAASAVAMQLPTWSNARAPANISAYNSQFHES